MTTSSKPNASGNEAEVRELLVARKGVLWARELDGLLDWYAAAALVGGAGEKSPREREAARGRVEIMM